ncbi:HAD family hydrolase [Marispirochaeta sp.]|jgi:putative hydrolase of the HAD superfamily|uniref:HAD family hydrolase n=1 Tax=Marispirochaeta sp. TaxID=2038653 RepID=UPI0029C97696|nr:HAD family hydrolase [Marispirochaeta sp.]
MKFRAVAFDIDGTLYPNFHMYLYSLIPALKHPLLALNFGRVRKEIREVRPVENFRHLQARMLADYMGCSPEHAFALAERFLYERWVTSFKGLKPFPGVRAVLDELKHTGFKLAAMSDFPIQSKLDYLGLSGLWDTAFTAEDTNYLKPHPEPFLRLIHELGFRQEEILYVGNSYSYDIEGASAVGIHTAHLTRRPVPASKADFSFYRYSDLRDFVFSHSGV